MLDTACSPFVPGLFFVRPFVVIDDKGGEIVIKASDVFHVLPLFLEICTAEL